MNPTTTFTLPRRSADIRFAPPNWWRSGFVSMALIALIWCGFCTVSSGQITISKYLNDDGHGNCNTWWGSDNVCVSLDASVGSDATPGDYTYDLLCNTNIIGGGGNTVRLCCGYGHQTTVHVNPDPTYSFNPDSGIACMTNAGERGLSQLYLGASGPSGFILNEGW